MLAEEFVHHKGTASALDLNDYQKRLVRVGLSARMTILRMIPESSITMALMFIAIRYPSV